MIQLLSVRTFLFLAVVVLMTGCGGGGGSDDPAPPAGSSNWDSMTWDQDNWS